MRDKRRKLSSSWTEFYVLAAHSSSGSGYVFLIGFTLEYVEYRTASFVPLVALHPLFLWLLVLESLRRKGKSWTYCTENAHPTVSNIGMFRFKNALNGALCSA